MKIKSIVRKLGARIRVVCGDWFGSDEPTRYLVCYEIGMAHSSGHASGHVFTTQRRIDEATLGKLAESLIEDVKKDNPQYTYTNVVWRSVYALPNARGVPMPTGSDASNGNNLNQT